MKTTSLCLKRILPADMNRVFEAWTRAEAMSCWLVCNSSWTAKATNDLRVGGKYRVVMRDSDGSVGIASGEYVEIQPPHRLVFTWSSEGRISVKNSIVTIELKALGAETELTLTHDVDLDTNEGRAHADGWEGALANLRRYLDVAIESEEGANDDAD